MILIPIFLEWIFRITLFLILLSLFVRCCGLCFDIRVLKQTLHLLSPVPWNAYIRLKFKGKGVITSDCMTIPGLSSLGQRGDHGPAGCTLPFSLFTSIWLTDFIPRDNHCNVRVDASIIYDMQSETIFVAEHNCFKKYTFPGTHGRLCVTVLAFTCQKVNVNENVVNLGGRNW